LIRTFTFNGITSNQYFFVNETKRPILPPVDVRSFKIPKKAGVRSFYSDLDARVISVRVTMLATNQTNFRDRVRQIASWLFTTEDKDLFFNDEPARIYKARLQNETALDQLVTIGEATLDFICSDPFAYRSWEKSVLLTSNDGTGTGSEVVNEGTASAFPVLRLFPMVNITSPLVITNLENNKKMTFLADRKTLFAWTPTRIDHRNNTAFVEATGKTL
jgi:predicted phage tail component-like protein